LDAVAGPDPGGLGFGDFGIDPDAAEVGELKQQGIGLYRRTLAHAQLHHVAIRRRVVVDAPLGLPGFFDVGDLRFG